MSSSAVLCPGCRRILGYRRRNGNVSLQTDLEISDGVISLVCGECGGRKVIEGVQPILLSA